MFVHLDFQCYNKCVARYSTFSSLTFCFVYAASTVRTFRVTALLGHSQKDTSAVKPSDDAASDDVTACSGGKRFKAKTPIGG